jgi:hypothetical protein
MRFMGTVLALLLSVLLSGCSTRNPTSTVAAATVPQVQQHNDNRYQLRGSPDKVALLLDSETGQVWRYKGSDFEAVPVQGILPCGTVAYSDKGKIYDIPCEKVMAFLHDHPNAKVVP